MQRILLVAAVMIGGLIAYVDSRPTWNDTGITAGALFFSAMIVGSFARRRHWLYGIAIGIWIPCLQIYRTHDIRLLVILSIPLVGIFVGWGCRKVFLDRYKTV